MRLITEPYLRQVDKLPKVGNHILAQFDESSIVVYQAYRSAIGKFAAIQSYFGGEFSLKRMRLKIALILFSSNTKILVTIPN